MFHSGQNNGGNDLHTRTVHLSLHRRAEPHKQQQCRWDEHVDTHTLTLFFLFVLDAHTYSTCTLWFMPSPFVRVHNLLCHSTPNETPYWVWLDLIRVDSIEAGGEGGEYGSAVCVCVFQVLQDTWFPASNLSPSVYISINVCLTLNCATSWAPSHCLIKVGVVQETSWDCRSAKAPDSLSVLSSWCISHGFLIYICTDPHSRVHTQKHKSRLLYHLGQFPTVPSRHPLVSRNSTKLTKWTYVVHSGACGKVPYLRFKGFVHYNYRKHSVFSHLPLVVLIQWMWKEFCFWCWK